MLGERMLAVKREASGSEVEWEDREGRRLQHGLHAVHGVSEWTGRWLVSRYFVNRSMKR